MFASALLQSIIGEPLWFEAALEAVVSLLAIPAVSSLVVSAARKFKAMSGFDPRSLVWVVCMVISGIAYAQAPLALPILDSANPAEFVAGWMLLGNGYYALTKKLYDWVLSRIPWLTASE